MNPGDAEVVVSQLSQETAGRKEGSRSRDRVVPSLCWKAPPCPISFSRGRQWILRSMPRPTNTNRQSSHSLPEQNNKIEIVDEAGVRRRPFVAQFRITAEKRKEARGRKSPFHASGRPVIPPYLSFLMSLGGRAKSQEFRGPIKPCQGTGGMNLAVAAQRLDWWDAAGDTGVA